MDSLRRGRWALGLAVGLVLGLAPQGRGADADKDKEKPQPAAKGPVPVKFETADQVELRGLYYPSAKKTDAACVIMLHDTAGNIREKGWSSLADALQTKGYAVLTFDFRGHGQSTSVDPQAFWSNPINQRMVRGGSGKKLRETISFKDFAKGYTPYLINDIAAAKAFLDGKNDSGDCNSSNIILIGAGEGATLGALWLKEERSRYQITGGQGLGARPQLAPQPESKDVIAAVWLSITPKLGGPQGIAVSLTGLLRPGMKDKKIPMAFIYSDKDTSSKNLAATVLKMLNPKNDKKLLIGKKAITRATAASKGRGLLIGNLGTVDAITAYLDSVLEKEGGLNAHDTKEFKKQDFLWVGVPVRPPLAKSRGEKTLKFIPANAYIGGR